MRSKKKFVPCGDCTHPRYRDIGVRNFTGEPEKGPFVMLQACTVCGEARTVEIEESKRDLRDIKRKVKK